MGVANSRLLMLPNSEIRQNEGVGKASGFVRDAKAELFLREFRCLPYCAVAPEECVCYRYTILWLKCVAVMFVRLIA